VQFGAASRYGPNPLRLIAGLSANRLPAPGRRGL